MQKTGIALFVYKRPEHTKKVLESLKNNNIDKLYIFSDGPKNSADVVNIKEVRKLLNCIDWCEKEVIVSENNKGLAQSIVEGVNYVLGKHERIIVLEDDCVPSPDFIYYMNKCFDKYQFENRVMHVSGFSYPISIPAYYNKDVYFTHRPSSWGWGTWKSSWSLFRRELCNQDEFGDFKEIFSHSGSDLPIMLQNQLDGKIDSWAIWWGYSIAKNDGLCVNPVISRVKNIGDDGSGTHSAKINRYKLLNRNKAFGVDIKNTISDELIFPEEIMANNDINNIYLNYIHSITGNTPFHKALKLIRKYMMKI